MTTQHQITMIRSLLSDEMMETDGMFLSYPDGYNQQVADFNNRVFRHSVMMTFEGVGRDEMARILIDAGLALTISRAYYCARREIARLPGTTDRPVEVKGAFVSLRWFVILRERFEDMDPMLDGNEDLAEIVQNIQHDGLEGRDLLRWG